MSILAWEQNPIAVLNEVTRGEPLKKVLNPIDVLLQPHTIAFPEERPKAVLHCPIINCDNALYPLAVLLLSVVLEDKAKWPIAKFCDPVVLRHNELLPRAKNN